MQLAERRCKPCEGEHERPLPVKETLELLRGLPDWRIEKGRLKIDYELGTFAEAVYFLDKIAAIASEEEHTPDVCIVDYNKMRLSLYTYCCGGLTENDFILAAKIGRAHDEFLKI